MRSHSIPNVSSRPRWFWPNSMTEHFKLLIYTYDRRIITIIVVVPLWGNKRRRNQSLLLATVRCAHTSAKTDFVL